MSAPSSSEHKIEPEVVQEGVTMALYISLSLLAVLVATQTITFETKGEVARTVLLTACGLLVAHLLAFGVSSRLVSKGSMDNEARHTVAAQICAGLIVTLVATLPTLLLDPEISLRVARLLLLGLVCFVGYLAARNSGGTRFRALVYSALVLVAALLVLLVKGLVEH